MLTHWHQPNVKTHHLAHLWHCSLKAKHSMEPPVFRRFTKWSLAKAFNKSPKSCAPQTPPRFTTSAILFHGFFIFILNLFIFFSLFSYSIWHCGIFLFRSAFIHTFGLLRIFISRFLIFSSFLILSRFCLIFSRFCLVFSWFLSFRWCCIPSFGASTVSFTSTWFFCSPFPTSSTSDWVLSSDMAS